MDHLNILKLGAAISRSYPELVQPILEMRTMSGIIQLINESTEVEIHLGDTEKDLDLHIEKLNQISTAKYLRRINEL